MGRQSRIYTQFNRCSVCSVSTELKLEWYISDFSAEVSTIPIFLKAAAAKELVIKTNTLAVCPTCHASLTMNVKACPEIYSSEVPMHSV
jgi:hypothetical protein